MGLNRGGRESFGGFCVHSSVWILDHLTMKQWTLSALQLHPWALIVVDEEATAGPCTCFAQHLEPVSLTLHLELHVKTVKYFKSIEYVQKQVDKAKEVENKAG